MNWLPWLWEAVDFIMDLLHDSMTHYVVGFAVGSLAYYSMWTTLYAACRERLSATSGLGRMAVVFSMHLSVTLFSFCLAYLSHLLLDGISCWYFMPLDTLNLVDWMFYCPR
jgi:hypothetical protein